MAFVNERRPSVAWISQLHFVAVTELYLQRNTSGYMIVLSMRFSFSDSSWTLKNSMSCVKLLLNLSSKQQRANPEIMNSVNWSYWQNFSKQWRSIQRISFISKNCAYLMLVNVLCNLFLDKRSLSYYLPTL